MRKKRFQRKCTTAHFLAICDCLTPDSVESVQSAKRPTSYNGVKFKENLNNLSYGDLISLLELKTISDEFLKPLQIVEGFTEKEVLKADISVSAGYRNWIIEQVTTISKLFESLNSGITYSSDEIAAGVHSLNFGTFGIVDSYARRMGITNHDDVLKVSWVIIYQTMKIDNDTVAYQRRLNNQIHKRK